MRRFFKELGLHKKHYVVFCDIQSAIHFSRNLSFHAKSKHINMRYHWIQDVLDKELLKLVKINADKNNADMLTKGLPREKHVSKSGRQGL